MRVLIVNTSELTGGAAVAANRLKDALNNNGVKAKMLVRDKTTDDITVVELPGNAHSQRNFLFERWGIYMRLHFSKVNLWRIDTASFGTDITGLREFKEADVIHLSWINQGMLSLKNIQRIIDSGKPVVWTMHDEWMATGICHYTSGCTRFREGCHNCPLLPDGGSDHDLSYKIWQRKRELLRGSRIRFVACSEWLEKEALSSALLTGQRVTHIPNPIDMNLFRPLDKAECRLRTGLPADKNVILFVSQRVNDKRKGMSYLVKALDRLTSQHAEIRYNTVIAVLGGHSEEMRDWISLPVYPLGYVNDHKKIVEIYNSADVFVLPSMEDNLPNTVMEAMACGIPTVAFRTGGIPEMIEHGQTGFLAEYANADSLADGLWQALSVLNRDEVRENCLKSVRHKYSQHAVAMQYLEVYNEALEGRKPNL